MVLPQFSYLVESARRITDENMKNYFESHSIMLRQKHYNALETVLLGYKMDSLLQWDRMLIKRIRNKSYNS